MPRIRNSVTKEGGDDAENKDGFQFAVPLPPTTGKRRVTFADTAAATADNRRDSFGHQLPVVPNVLTTPRRSSIRGANNTAPATPTNGQEQQQQRSWNIQSPAVQKPTPSRKRELADANDENMADVAEDVFGAWA